MIASLRGQTEVVKMLLEKGADVNAKNTKGWTALMIASLRGQTEVVKNLLEKGADVNAKDEDGKSALKHAINNEIIKLLNARAR